MRRYRQRLERLFRRIPKIPKLPPALIYDGNAGRYEAFLTGPDFGSVAEYQVWLAENGYDAADPFILITCPDDPERDTDRPLPGPQSQGPSHSEGESGNGSA